MGTRHSPHPQVLPKVMRLATDALVSAGRIDTFLGAQEVPRGADAAASVPAAAAAAAASAGGGAEERPLVELSDAVYSWAVAEPWKGMAPGRGKAGGKKEKGEGKGGGDGGGHREGDGAQQGGAGGSGRDNPPAGPLSFQFLQSLPAAGAPVEALELQERKGLLSSAADSEVDGGGTGGERGASGFTRAGAERPGGDELREKRTVGPINLSLRQGELLLVAGPVASGKSTLLSGLLGEASTLGGRCLCSLLAQDAWSDPSGPSGALFLAYAPQTPWILNASVRRNVTLGGAGTQVGTDAAVAAASAAGGGAFPDDIALLWRCLEDSGLALDVWQLPRGAETEIGERGVTLSGGQKARLGLARALYAGFRALGESVESRPQPHAAQAVLFLLDAPLASLDANVSATVLAAVSRRCRGPRCACVLVAEATAATLAVADGLLVLDPDGRPSYIGPPSHSAAAALFTSDGLNAQPGGGSGARAANGEAGTPIAAVPRLVEKGPKGSVNDSGGGGSGGSGSGGRKGAKDAGAASGDRVVTAERRVYGVTDWAVARRYAAAWGAALAVTAVAAACCKQSFQLGRDHVLSRRARDLFLSLSLIPLL